MSQLSIAFLEAFTFLCSYKNSLASHKPKDEDRCKVSPLLKKGKSLNYQVAALGAEMHRTVILISEDMLGTRERHQTVSDCRVAGSWLTTAEFWTQGEQKGLQPPAGSVSSSCREQLCPGRERPLHLHRRLHLWRSLKTLKICPIKSIPTLWK